MFQIVFHFHKTSHVVQNKLTRISQCDYSGVIICNNQIQLLLFAPSTLCCRESYSHALCLNGYRLQSVSALVHNNCWWTPKNTPQMMSSYQSCSQSHITSVLLALISVMNIGWGIKGYICSIVVFSYSFRSFLQFTTTHNLTLHQKLYPERFV